MARGRLPAYVQASMPKPFFHPTSILPLPFLARQADPTGALASRVAVGLGAGSRLRVGLLRLPLPPPSPLHAQEGKKIRRERRKASAAKWLIGFYGNWLRSTPAAYPTVPLSPYF